MCTTVHTVFGMSNLSAAGRPWRHIAVNPVETGSYRFHVLWCEIYGPLSAAAVG
jgi:hypothetical protein